jgi:hypothetical protein
MAREGNRIIESEERWREAGLATCKFCCCELTYSEYRDFDGACSSCMSAMDPDTD